MLAEQLQEALVEREEMDQRARERFAEVALTNLQAIVQAPAVRDLGRDERRVLNMALRVSRGFLKGWAAKVGLRLREMDVDHVASPPSSRPGLRRHLVGLYGHLESQPGSDKAVKSLKLADRMLMSKEPRARAFG